MNFEIVKATKYITTHGAKHISMAVTTCITVLEGEKTIRIVVL